MPRRIRPNEIEQAQRFTVPADAFVSWVEDWRLEMKADGERAAGEEAEEIEREQTDG